MSNNWYDNPESVLQLARWMDDTSYASRDDIVKMLHHPHHRNVAWMAYQASLQPKEPTLSEWAEKLYGPGLHMEMAQRIEALEVKVGEL